ncbi:hypothetical protein MF628_004204 [Paenibacillus polymyxa]|uniref:hypothetical protein n=1 Tax=Paenibacillus polymyxa TaxID=1406 RepID=UPI0020246A3E|nr:hypothetical protein [Paenibacillus polymyxa]URJ44478.1 hypothetical protein MF628_004204 [Paenibacillus polymyxa]
MIKPNWDAFNVKFHDSKQVQFEWFCYLLFCAEFNKKNGIFRYLNQAAIETNLIESNGSIIGWQAKYYEGTLSGHVDELINTIEKAKKLYPSIDTLVIYTNSEWAQNKGQQPSGLLKVETVAQNCNITIDWRTKSFFESEFVTIESEKTSRFFFSLNESEFDEIKRREAYTRNLLSEIKNVIPFDGEEIHINRAEIIEKISDSENQVIVVSGNGGVGKTAVIKEYYDSFDQKYSLLLFKASEFELPSVEQLFQHITFDAFFSLFTDAENKIIVIDSAEKLLDLRNIDTFKIFLSRVIVDNWKVIFTSRSIYIDDLNYEFLDVYNMLPLNIHIGDLDEEELEQLASKYKFEFPKDYKLLELITNPFYLSEYLKFYKDNDFSNYQEFKNKLWIRNVKKAKPAREQCFMKLAHTRAESGQFFLSPVCDVRILDEELMPDGIVGYETAGYFITHDIYEEWALERIIESSFIKARSVNEFAELIGHSLAIRRAFRTWMSDKLSNVCSEVEHLVEGIMSDKSMQPFWKDELIVSVLLSPYSSEFFKSYKALLLRNDNELLKRVAFLLRLACKELDEQYMEVFSTKKPGLLNSSFVETKPKGSGWNAFIKFVYENLEQIGYENSFFVVPILSEWNSKERKGITTKQAGHVALSIYDHTFTNDLLYVEKEDIKEIVKTILNSAHENKELLEDTVLKIVENKWKFPGEPYYELSNTALDSIEGIYVSQEMPDSVIELAKLFWAESEKERSNRYYSSMMKIEKSFGLSSNRMDYYPSSAYQTTIYWMLHASMRSTIDFIIDFVNYSIELYQKSGFDPFVRTVTVKVSDIDNVEQYISNCLWNMYRGNGSPVSPDLLQSIHMALEKYLIEMAKEADGEIIESWLVYLLKKSKSASISSVVTSVVLAYPQKLFNVAQILFKTIEFFEFELGRRSGEMSLKSLYSIGYGLNQRNKVFQDERIRTCDEPHRQETLEELIVKYQFVKGETMSDDQYQERLKVIWGILDKYSDEISDRKTNEEVNFKEILVNRVDRRCMDPKIEEKDN